MRRFFNRRTLLVLLYAAVILAAGVLGYRMWEKHHAMQRIYDTSFNQYIGKADSEKIIVEFLDYRCHVCRMINPIMEELVERNPDIKIIHRHFPIFQRPSVIDAEIALAAGQHGYYEAAHKFLMSQEEPVSENEIDAFARSIGVPVQTFRYDMKGQKMGELLLETLRMSSVLGIHATPTFIIGDRFYRMEGGMPTVETFEEMLAEEYGE